MPGPGDETPTQPLPTLERARGGRLLLGRLALVSAAAWVSGGALVAAQYTAAADHAPRLVRGAVWSVAFLCLLAGAVCLLAGAAMLTAAVAVHCARAAADRRRILYGGVDGELAAERGHLVSLVAQAAALSEQKGAPQGRVLRLAGAEGRSVRRDRHGA
jgi:hypothetical protein